MAAQRKAYAIRFRCDVEIVATFAPLDLAEVGETRTIGISADSESHLAERIRLNNLTARKRKGLAYRLISAQAL
jgi:hypothetical protein